MISICMPNLNGAPFLEERIRTIQQQTFADYEVVVVDNYSDDGAFAILARYASSDPRVRLSQAPREGMYPNWNNCLRLARGEWIYVATSDDTMTPDCLEVLQAEAVRHAKARVVTSLPWVIDECGRTVDQGRDGVARRVLGRRRDNSGWTSPRAELLSAMTFGTPTLSITQLLTHRRAFEEVGLFPTMYGSTGDYAWQLRAIQRLPIYHVGRQLGSWRRHAAQATQSDVQPLHVLRARILVDWFRADRPELDAGMRVAFGYSLAKAGEEAPADLPESVRRWTTRMRRLLNRRSRLASTTLVAMLSRSMAWGARRERTRQGGTSTAVGKES